MTRRAKRWQPIGLWLRSARARAKLTQEELSERTGISVASLSRFESDQAQPAFGDICEIALALGWPLLHFAVGRERHADSVEALATELRYWGLEDLQLSQTVLLGEVREFEELIAVVISGRVEPRILEAIPALLLRNSFDANLLVTRSAARNCAHRAGWLSDVALSASQDLPAACLHPEAHRNLDKVTASAWTSLPPNPDFIDRLPTEKLKNHVWRESPPLARRWKVACDIPLDQFARRAKSLICEDGQRNA